MHTATHGLACSARHAGSQRLSDIYVLTIDRAASLHVRSHQGSSLFMRQSSCALTQSIALKSGLGITTGSSTFCGLYLTAADGAHDLCLHSMDSCASSEGMLAQIRAEVQDGTFCSAAMRAVQPSDPGGGLDTKSCYSAARLALLARDARALPVLATFEQAPTKLPAAPVAARRRTRTCQRMFAVPELQLQICCSCIALEGGPELLTALISVHSISSVVCHQNSAAAGLP